MFAKVNSLGLFGLNAFPVEVETEVSRGTPCFDIVGLADTSVKESRERIRAAFRSAGISFPLARVIVNLAPADTKKTGSMHDLAIFAALLKITGNIEENIDKTAFIGEVSLNGDVRHVNGVLPMVLCAERSGFDTVFVPSANAYEASVVEGVTVYGIDNVSELIGHFNREAVLIPQRKYEVLPEKRFDTVDFADVKGQQTAKKAMEYAAAGGHNLIMIGPPGSGKSMLAKRLSTIMPAMTFKESIETTNIHSVCGLVSKENPLVTKRPFRSPHHTISGAGLSGGGTIPRPGEISLAHNGILFLDELPEFSRQALEILRQPLEDKQVTISRASGTVTYPCSFMLVAAMNPCPCGYYPDRNKCRCTQPQIEKYLGKVSGPLLDRIDLCVELQPVDILHLQTKITGESSEQMRERIERARKMQEKRYAGTEYRFNGDVSSADVDHYCSLGETEKNVMEQLYHTLELSARAYHRILKTARTIADLEEQENIAKEHLLEAACYRPSGEYWG